MSNSTPSRASWGAVDLVTRPRNAERADGVAVFAVLAFMLALLAVVTTLATRNATTADAADVSVMFGP